MMTAQQVLNREFLEIRAKILELAASFDRLDRCAGDSPVSDDPRLARIREALIALQQPGGGRAEQVQMIFSRPYEEQWPEKLGVPAKR